MERKAATPVERGLTLGRVQALTAALTGFLTVVIVWVFWMRPALDEVTLTTSYLGYYACEPAPPWLGLGALFVAIGVLLVAIFGTTLVIYTMDQHDGETED